VAENAGLYPTWNQQFNPLPIYSYSDEVSIQCFDKDILTTTLISENWTRVGELCSKEISRRWIHLWYKSEPAGILLIETKLIENEDEDIDDHKTLKGSFNSSQ
jgi:hypothetical protein